MYFWLGVLLLTTGSSLSQEEDLKIPKQILDIDKERMLKLQLIVK